MAEKHWQDEILAVYYKESTKTLEKIASDFQVDFQKCLSYFNELSKISTVFQNMPQRGASLLSLQKIEGFAKEQAAKKQGFFGFFHPRWAWQGAFAVIAIMVFSYFATISSQNQIHSGDSQVAVQTFPEAESLEPPFSYERSFFHNAPTTKTWPSHGVGQPVNFGNRYDDFAEDELLDKKILTQSTLTDEELESLYYRARKFEQMGNYQKALRDYRFISRFYPHSTHNRVVLLSMASCYEVLKDKGRAIQILEQVQNTYGSSRDLELWIEELKSVTF